ncbi:MAG: CDP-glycerol glycerophosphotransferase family protein [Bacillota bacterium]
MKSFLMRTAVGALRALYVPFKARGVGNRITFISRQSDRPSADILMLSERVKEKRPDAECVILAKKLEGAGAIGYGFHMLNQMKHMAVSRVVVLDGYCIAASVLKHRSETKIIQMWHSLAAIKKFGYQALDMPSGRSSEVAEIMCMHRNYDYVIAPSEETGRFYCEAFDVEPEKLRYYGLPRIDLIKREDGAFAEEVRREYGFDDGKELILYAPTFRKGKAVDARPLIEMAEEEGFHIIVKLHPLHDDGSEYVDRKYSSHEWLKVCDRVITDYSAIGVEAALTGKPVYYYTYDSDDYKREVGLNIDPEEEMPWAAAGDTEALRKLLRGPYSGDREKEFLDRYVSVPTDDCTDRLADFLAELLDRR